MADKQFFGTDGVRGKVGGDYINPVFARRLGKAVALWVTQEFPGHGDLRAVIGRDTRASGVELTQAVADGLASCGCTVLDCTVVPTPAVAQAVLSNQAQIGVVITASHNPASDNGIKFFKSDGFKLSDEQEVTVEQLLLEQTSDDGEFPEATMQPIDALEAYVQSLSSILPAQALKGWNIVLDTANGATYQSTQQVLDNLGAHIHQIGGDPDGHNINDGIGSEHPDRMAKLVLDHGAKIGIAHDGDGDRLVLCDEHGSVLDGDEVLAMRGIDLMEQEIAPSKTFATTVMSNLGLDEALEKKGGNVERTGVGDRNVVIRMRETGAIWGGESSGHFVCLDHATTGDGLLAALLVMQAMARKGQPLSELRQCMRFYPQQKQNLYVSDKPLFADVEGMPDALDALETSLGRGRTLLRYSGTESMVRLLVEAEDGAAASEGMERLEALVRQYLPVVE